MQTRLQFPKQLILALLALSLILTSCAANLPPLAANTSGFPLASPPYGRGILVTSASACAYEFVDAKTMPFNVGPTACKYAEALVKSLFRQQEVVSTAPVLTPRAAGVAVVTIRILSIDFSQAVLAWRDDQAAATIEFRASDTAGAVLWIDTIRGEANGAMGTTFNAEKNQSKLIGQALLEAFMKARTSMQASPSLRTFFSAS